MSHDTALDAWGVTDINRDRVHVTIGRTWRIRRRGGEGYRIHYQELAEDQVTWWQGIPTVTLATAILQGIESGVPSYLIRQVLQRSQGGSLEREWLTAELGERDGE